MHGTTHLQRFLPTRLRTSQQRVEAFVPSKTYKYNECVFKRDTLLVQYARPTKSDMLVIIPFFNPCNSVRIVQNLLLVVNKLTVSGIPFVIVHCLFPDSTPLMSESSSYITVKSSSYAFVKENLANIAISRNRATYFKFAVVDGDIIFENKRWYDELSRELDTSDIVQPFTTYHHVDYNFAGVRASGIGIFSIFDEVRLKRKNIVGDLQGHTGFAIAFTKKYIDTIGYPDETLIGGGDTLTCSIALKLKLYGDYNRKHFDALFDKYRNTKEIKTRSLAGAVYHLYHNITTNRQYSTRYNILNKYINDDTPYNNIDDLVYKNKDGVYEWKEEIRDAMNEDILNFFSSRQDDDIVMSQP